MNRRTFAGLPIVVENPAGSTRQWFDRDGRVSGSTLMKHDYGFIEDHIGSDGEELDCYLGPDELAPFVHVVHQMKAPEYSGRDEDKIMLGFADEGAARAAYLAHRNDGDKQPGPYGGMSSMPLEKFKAKLERRTGTGPIRAEATMPDNVPALFGDLVLLEVPRGADGKIRVGLWDRGMTPGRKIQRVPNEKGEPVDVETIFAPETFAQMIDNWLRRGEPLSCCYNHQSAYAKDNGAPAPALSFYDAVAVVSGGRVVQFEKLGSSSATPPDVAQLAELAAKMATDANPNPSPDGCWWFRCEVTEIGEKLLPSYKFLSPMFVKNGMNERGEQVGYVIFDLAATNTAFQAGCMINFANRAGRAGDNPHKGEPTMAKKFDSTMAKKMGLLEGADDKAIKQSYATKLMEGNKCMAGADDPAAYKRFSDEFEEMAKAYEDAYGEDKEPDGDEAPHITMRRMASKFRKLGAVDGGAGGDKDAEAAKMAKDGAASVEMAAKMERALQAEYRTFAQRLQIDVAAGATSAQLFEAIKAASVPASKLPELVDARVKLALVEASAKATLLETADKAQHLVAAAIEGGYPVENKDALLTFASVPQNFAAAHAMAAPFLKGQGEKSLLFSRITMAGAPLGADLRREGDVFAHGPDRRVVENQLATFVVEGEKFSLEAKKMADAKDGPIKMEIDEMLGEGERAHGGLRLIAANRLLKTKRPDLWQAAELQNLGY